MNKNPVYSNIEPVERRKHWRDRRSGNERRNAIRLRFTSYDCRSGRPRRSSDVAGELSEGSIWWNKKVPQYE